MVSLSDTHHFRKMLAGAAMMLAPACVLLGAILHPSAPAEPAGQLAVAAGEAGRWTAAHLVLLASAVLALPAVLGLMHMLRERRAAYGHVGGALALLGLLAFVGVLAIELVLGEMAQSGSRRAMVALLERMGSDAAIAAPFLYGTLAFGLGLIVLALGLYEARAVAWWQALALALGGVGLVIAPPLASTVIAIVGAVLFLAGLGSIGMTVLTESDADWEHTPEWRGFRPLAGSR
jgi:hypothetical protein